MMVATETYPPRIKVNFVNFQIFNDYEFNNESHPIPMTPRHVQEGNISTCTVAVCQESRQILKILGAVTWAHTLSAANKRHPLQVI
jgi:hypothetical protein